jgi:hypothetical protein
LCLQVKGYSGNSYKGFQTREEAEAWIRTGLVVSVLGGNQQDRPFPLDVVQATSSSTHTPEVQVDDSREDNTAVNVINTSTTAKEGTGFNEASLGPSAVPVEEARPVLSNEQQRVVDLALAGNSIFFTGSAGLSHLHF